MKQNCDTVSSTNQMVSQTNIIRLLSQGQTELLSDSVVAEQPVTIMIDKVGSYTIMATPCDIEALAVGFVYSEGMIDSIDDIVAVSAKQKLPNVVGIEVQEPTRITVHRNMIVASSCGMCGTRNIDKMLSEMHGCDRSLEISSSLITDAAAGLSSMQQIFQMTGGSHAAAIFNASGKIIAFAEDLGRHSALDKAIGKCLINRLNIKACAVILSGRVSLEMVTKTARAGLELIAAVSAPSSIAVEAAKRWNITLCGFVRSGRMNIYTHPDRITDLRKGT
ncbi:MAG: formate dehydrogenase accessory sulfurtransferase FdhD [Anaerohalosphaera sp.]|nr:formate dehydrogenase accessory sulfurtransferase FdhD [Anaerohalosphaera sp.]